MSIELMQTFRDPSRHWGSAPPHIVGLLTGADRAAGRQEAFARQHPAELETLREVALVQSAEASNAIENIHAPHHRIKELVEQTAQPENRSEQEIAGYRYVLDVMHGNAHNMGFEPRFVEQLHGYLARFTGDPTAGKFKKLDNTVEEVHPDGRKAVRFVPVSADATPAAMKELHERFNAERSRGTYHHLLLTAGYVLDFLVIHPFRDGNGRMSRLITLWLLYLGGYEVGRYISLEKVVEDSKETYYEALARSTAGWHTGEHDTGPWTEYFLGVMNAAYKEFEDRTTLLGGRGSKRARILRFIETSVSNEFTVEDVRKASPGASDSYIKQVLQKLKEAGTVEPVGRGRYARWRRLQSEVTSGNGSTPE